MIINLCFHGVGVCRREREPGESRYWVSEDLFRRVLDEAVAFPQVRLSFDDGNASDVRIALPALAERGLTATFFPLAGRLDDPASLHAADLQTLRAAGMRIGSHGWAHVPWRGLTADAAAREFDAARRVLADAAGAAIDTAALPLGRYDRRTIAGLKAAGYRTVYTSDRFPARESAWLQARYSITAADTVASIRRVFAHTVALRDIRNLAASIVKRLR